MRLLGQLTLAQLTAQRAALQVELDALPHSWSFQIRRARLTQQIAALTLQIDSFQEVPPPGSEGPGPTSPPAEISPWYAVGALALFGGLFLLAGRTPRTR